MANPRWMLVAIAACFGGCLQLEDVEDGDGLARSGESIAVDPARVPLVASCDEGQVPVRRGEGWTCEPLAGGLTETDPNFDASAASGITDADVTSWNTAAGWGDHSGAGYLTSSSIGPASDQVAAGDHDHDAVYVLRGEPLAAPVNVATFGSSVLGDRRLVYQKVDADTALRVTYFDHFAIFDGGGNGPSTTCNWEVFFNGAPCAFPGRMIYTSSLGISLSLSAGTGGTNWNTTHGATITGVCSATAEGPIDAGQEVTLTVVASRTTGDRGVCTLGALGGGVALIEVQEVLCDGC